MERSGGCKQVSKQTRIKIDKKSDDDAQWTLMTRWRDYGIGA